MTMTDQEQKEQNKLHQRAFRARMSKERKKEFDRQRYQKYKEKWAERNKADREKNPIRHKAYSCNGQVKYRYPEAGKIPIPELIKWLTETAEEPCNLCGDDYAGEIDHIIPLSRGGKHEISNLRRLCKECNISKWDFLDSEFITHIEKILRHLGNSRKEYGV